MAANFRLLGSLSAPTRRLWMDREKRRAALDEVVGLSRALYASAQTDRERSREESALLARHAERVASLDCAVAETVAIWGLPRRPLARLVVGGPSGNSGFSPFANELGVALESLTRFEPPEVEGEPLSLLSATFGLRTWLHESLHARASLAGTAPAALRQTDLVIDAFEEAVVDELTDRLCADLGLIELPPDAGYSCFRLVLRALGEALEVEPAALARRAALCPAGSRVGLGEALAPQLGAATAAFLDDLEAYWFSPRWLADHLADRIEGLIARQAADPEWQELHARLSAGTGSCDEPARRALELRQIARTRVLEDEVDRAVAARRGPECRRALAALLGARRARPGADAQRGRS